MTKDNIFTCKNKYIYFAALIGFGFFWTGTAYIVQSYRLLHFLDGDTVNLLVCGVYYVCQAAGISVVGFFFAKRPMVAGGRAFPFWSTIVTVACAAAAMFVSSIPIIIAAGALMNVTIGMLSGCYLTRLATDIPQQRRGIVFGAAYAFGSIGTWLLSLPMHAKFLWSGLSFYAVAILAVASLILLPFLSPPPRQSSSLEQLSPRFGKEIIWLAAALLFLISLENTLGFSFPLKSASDSVYIEFARAFYAPGLIIAGLVSDKNRRWGAMCCLAALAFPFAALALGNSTVGMTVMWMIAYLFLGFWSTYRILLFSDISARRGLPGLAVVGLLAGRLGESAGTLGAKFLTGTPLIVVSGIVFALVIVLFFSLYHKIYSPTINAEDMEKQRLLEYASRFKLSPREREIFNLIVQGMSNAEIATALFITESTVKFHAGNIFKKTDLSSRSALIADYMLRDKN
ncbi:MAG: LuxR C-terminal-related transcriptional regulator [Lachnospiraceae bacterium]|jgi:DNA-binding CsgD family transcriptional regulator/MFS family permease